MSYIDYYSNYLKREIKLSDELKTDIINEFIRASKSTLFLNRPTLDFHSIRIHLRNKYYHSHPPKYDPHWDYEVFEKFATAAQKTEFRENQQNLEGILTDCAHNLDTIGLSNANIRKQGVNFGVEPHGFAKWLSGYKQKEKLPHYSSFFAFHLERLASQAILENKSIRDWSSLSNATLRSVEEHPDITIYAHHHNGHQDRDHTPGMYLDALRIFSSQKTMEAIKAIINKRRAAEKSKGKIKAEDISPNKVKASSGISEVMAEASGTRPRKQRQIIGGGKSKKPQKPTPWSFAKKP